MNRFALTSALALSLVGLPGLGQAQQDNNLEILQSIQEVRTMMYPMVDKDPQLRTAYDRLGQVLTMIQSGGARSTAGQPRR